MEPSRNTDKFDKMQRFLSGLSDFGKRSLNLSVLVNDQPLRKAYSAAEAEGELPTNRARVLILGEPRAGKTSLLNRLLGQEFDLHEQPTHGIETRMCHVTNVDKQWNETGSAKADDIRECAAAIAVLEEASSEGPQKEDVNRIFFKASPSSTESFFSSASVETGLLNICKQLSIFFEICVVMFAFLFCGLSQFGYAAFVLVCIGSLTLVLDYNVAFRCATCVSVSFALFEAMIRLNEHHKKLYCTVNDDFAAVDLFMIQNIALNVVNTVLFGTACGLGFRTGIAVAFSASVHPWETSSGNRGWHSVSSWSTASLCLVLLAGSLSGGASYKYCTVNDRLHRRRTMASCFLITLLFAVYVNVECSCRLLLFIFMNGYVMTVGIAWGFMFGRRAVMKYGFEARYVTKKTIGLIFGFYLVHMCGWTLKLPGTSLTSLAFFTFSVVIFPLFDLYTAYRIWSMESTFPVKTIRNQIKALIQGQPLLETKLSLWDFAGDTLYHCTHHVFMPDRALYVIVFNLEAAVSNEDIQVQKLLFWLHSVCAHARHPDAVVMIVGTHKTSVPAADIKCFTDNLHNRITSKFCDRLVLNPVDDKPLFLVENSDFVDQDFRQLRAEIYRRVESAEYAQEKYPIKYLHFYREIQNRRKLAQQASECAKNVATLGEIQVLAREKCEVGGEEQLKKMLRYFCEAGEIIYREEDEILRQHVILDPQFLVDVMKKLVDIPRGCHRSHRYAIEWRNYENTGIISEELLQHIYCEMPHLIPLLTNLLQAFDLMGSVEPTQDPSCSQPSFLVPAMLPPFEGEGAKFWESQDKEEVFYFDFGFFDPTTIYYRLLTRCLAHANRNNEEPHTKPLIFADRCRFHIGTNLIFKLQLDKGSSQQQLLSVAILRFDSENSSLKLLEFLVDAVRSITARDYSHLNFTFGPRCLFCDGPPPSNEVIDVKQHDQAIHVLKMAGNDKSFPTKPSTVMFCGVRRYNMKLSKSMENLPSTSHPPQRVLFGPETLISKIPPDLFDKVCCFLNTRGQRSWKTLAGELGKDVDFVAALDSEGVTNPSEYLLKEWAMKGGVTVADLLEVLDRPCLERKDIIQEVRAQMS